MPQQFRHAPLTLLALLAAACGADISPSAPLAESASTAISVQTPGAVAVANNSPGGNSILVFARRGDGTLEAPQSFATGGAGTGAGLGNQGGVRLTGSRAFLLAVNAGSNDVSIFSVSGTTLSLTDRIPSGGSQPISVTQHEGIVYVLNAGGEGNIAGFRLSSSGRLTALAGAIQPLSSTAAGPAEIGFSPDGTHLVVTEKATNTITVYDVDRDGSAGAPHPQPSVGMTPFGFAFDLRGRLLVTEAFGGATDASALSSYLLGRDGVLRVRSGSVGTTETAACWVAITPDGRYAYATNTGSGTVTGYQINADGSLRLLNADGATGQTGTAPIDLAITPDGRRVYTLDSSSHQLSVFTIRRDGSLEAGAATTGLPGGTNGMATW